MAKGVEQCLHPSGWFVFVVAVLGLASFALFDASFQGVGGYPSEA